MPTKTKSSPGSKPAASVAKPKLEGWDKDYAQVPLWLTRSKGLTHAQFRVLVVLITVLRRRRGWWHISYTDLAALAFTDTNTVTYAIKRFVDEGWLSRQGGRNYRMYRLHIDILTESLRKEYSDQYDTIQDEMEDEAG